MSGILSRFQQLPLAFGGAAISGEGGGYGFGEISEVASIHLLHKAFDAGVHVFDTAPIYGFGLSEERMGKAFHHIREKVFLISKCGVTWHDNRRVNMTNDPKISGQMLHASLRRLQTEYIDLYMIHWPDPRVDIRRTMEVLAKAKEQGKILSIGLCNTHRDDLLRAMEISKIEVVQSELNLFNNWVVDNLLSILSENQIEFMSWGTLDKGILSGRVKTSRTFDKSDARSWAPWWKERNNLERIKRVEKVSKFLETTDFSVMDLAIDYNLNVCASDMILVGSRTHEQLSEVICSISKKVPKEIMERAREILNG